MRRSYSSEVRGYVVVERYKGKPWKQIAAEVGERFAMKPPSIRIMQNWFQAYQASTDDPTGVKFVATAVEEATSRAVPIVYARMMGEIPHLLELHEKYNVPLDVAGWMSCLRVMEEQVGREVFDRIVARYRKLRGQVWP
jgi:hypothetical protein